ncbi:lipoprotein [Spirochaetia bacterium]|nr:lipoprotein [Spirochaetia bacterium]
MHITFLLTSVFFISCSEDNIAELWTDRAEFAFYAQYFNASQNNYKIEVRQFNDLTNALTNTKEKPDIVAGSWLKSKTISSRWRPLNFILNKHPNLQKSFYPPLLALGKIGKNQYLFPVSFDLPIIIFSKNNNITLSNPFTIDLEEIRNTAKVYNVEKNGIFSRMGFSPLWNNEFLYQTAVLFGASFKEDSPLEWNTDALNATTDYIKNWIHEIDGGVQTEDDFIYKYFFDPPSKLVTTGRILFAYMRLSDFFTTASEVRSNLDFRMLAGDKTIPVCESECFYALDKKGNSKGASVAFTEWFFNETTQSLLLEESRKNHLADTIFGIAGGFSAMQTVTENIFQQFYPGLLGHQPYADFLVPANILPQNWPQIRDRVVIPYIREQARNPGESKNDLEDRIAEWLRFNKREFSQ